MATTTPFGCAKLNAERHLAFTPLGFVHKHELALIRAGELLLGLEERDCLPAPDSVF